MINIEHIQVTAMQREAAEDVVGRLAVSDYSKNFQPTYADEEELLDGVHELHATVAVTTPRQVDAVAKDCAEIATGVQQGPLLMIGNCNEAVEVETPITVLRERMQKLLGVVACSAMQQAKTVIRGFGQSNKPRSKELETLADGTTVVSYMGDMVNGGTANDREPDPTRLVSTAVQARDVAADLAGAVGYHVPAAHEALLLAYEESFTRTDPESGDDYLLSADIPWIGVRTNDPNGEHVELLSRVKNTVGIKIGPGTSAEHIRQLAERLDPDNRPGKLIFMIRLGMDNMDDLPDMLESIESNAPNSIIMYDIHGTTKSLEDGTKIRLVSDIIDEIKHLSAACRSAGLRLHGLHLEAMSDGSRLECTDILGQRPTHPGNIDPQLNPRQLKQVLDETAHCFQQ